MYGTQTGRKCSNVFEVFENDVKMYGTQTVLIEYRLGLLFENDVKMYGTQTEMATRYMTLRLRMM